jgi:hypothetical protein
MTFSWYPRARTGRRDAFLRAGVGRVTANKDFLIAERNILWWEQTDKHLVTRGHIDYQ